jgi:hypothetical protein
LTRSEEIRKVVNIIECNRDRQIVLKI